MSFPNSIGCGLDVEGCSYLGPCGMNDLIADLGFYRDYRRDEANAYVR